MVADSPHDAPPVPARRFSIAPLMPLIKDSLNLTKDQVRDERVVVTPEDGSVSLSPSLPPSLSLSLPPPKHTHEYQCLGRRPGLTTDGYLAICTIGPSGVLCQPCLRLLHNPCQDRFRPPVRPFRAQADDGWGPPLWRHPYLLHRRRELC